MINNWKEYSLVNENLQKARSILRKLDIPESNPNFVELRNTLSRNTGYLGKFTHWHFIDGVSIDQLKNLYNRIRNTRLSKPIDDFKSPEEIIDTIIRQSSDSAVNQMVNAIPSNTRRDLILSACDNCEGEGITSCPTCEGEGVIDCESCEGEGGDCESCEGEGYHECPTCKGESNVKCNCEESDSWVGFLNFLKLHADKKDIIIDFFSKKGGRYGDDISYDTLDIIENDINKILNIPTIEDIKKVSLDDKSNIRFIYEDDTHLIVASNFDGLQSYGSSYWCITEDEDTFYGYVYDDGYYGGGVNINIQLILYVKGKKPLVDEKSMMGITYDISKNEVSAAHWEDDSSASGVAEKIIRSIKFDPVLISKSLDLYDHDDSIKMYIFPEKYLDKIVSIAEAYTLDETISVCPDIFLDNFINFIKLNVDKFSIDDFDMVVEYDLFDKVSFNKFWLSITTEDLIALKEVSKSSNKIMDTEWLFTSGKSKKDKKPKGDEYLKKAIDYLTKNGWEPTKSSKLVTLINNKILNFEDVFKLVDYNSIAKTYKDKFIRAALELDFEWCLSNSQSEVFIMWIVSNNKISKYKSKVIDVINKGLDKKSLESIIDNIDDDDIEVLAAKSLISGRLKKKWQIDFRRFENLMSFKDFKNIRS